MHTLDFMQPQRTLTRPAPASTVVAAVALAVAVSLLAGCAIGPNYKRPDVETPERYKEREADAATAPSSAPAGEQANAAVNMPAGEAAASSPASAPAAASAKPPSQWWALFDDPTLNDLEAQVEVSNQNLRASEAAYRQAAAAIREARAAFFPQITLDAGATRAGGAGLSRSTVVDPGDSTVTTRSRKSFEAGASASWEIDLWGRLRRSLENARALAAASKDDLAFAKLSIQGQLAIAYLQLREADAEQRLLVDTVKAYARSLEIAQNRYSAGVAAKTDVLQAQTQLFNAQDQATALTLQRAQLEHAIAALVGKPASNFDLPPRDEWATAVPDVPAGVPSTLVQRRPDIAAAERRVAAANAIIGVEQADYLPSLTLTGGYDFLSTTVGDLFKAASETHSVGASATEALFNGGATRARVAQARAAHEQSVAEYRQSVIDAFQDVEDQLAASKLFAQQYEYRRQASDAADETERMTMNQYRAGTVGYTNVVIAQTAALTARRALAVIALSRQTAAVSLITALGGGWEAAP